MTDKSPATQAVKVTDWEAYADKHADKLRQTRQRLHDRVAVLSEFGMDSLKIADEITRLRQEIEQLTGDLATAHAQLDTARDVVRPLATAWGFQEKYLPDSADLTVRYFWKPNSNTGDIPGISFADGQAAAEWLAGQGVAG